MLQQHYNARASATSQRVGWVYNTNKSHGQVDLPNTNQKDDITIFCPHSFAWQENFFLGFTPRLVAALISPLPHLARFLYLEK